MSRSKLEMDYRKLKEHFLKLGFACDGSLSKVFQECGKPACRCHKAKRYRHGPYYLWTRKVKGKTVTRQISSEHASLCREWLDNNRRLNTLIRGMRTLTLRAAPWNQ